MSALPKAVSAVISTYQCRRYSTTCVARLVACSLGTADTRENAALPKTQSIRTSPTIDDRVEIDAEGALRPISNSRRDRRQAIAASLQQVTRGLHPPMPWHLQSRPRPPDTSIRWAFTHRLSSDRSEAIIATMSSGNPTRPSAVMPARRLFRSKSSRTIPPLKSVAVGPGATVFTAMRRDPNSFAKTRVSTSALDFVH